MSGPRPVVFIDLDGTLLYRPQRFGADPCDLVEITPQGAAAIGRTARALLGELVRLADVVPATSRSPEQFERLDLPELSGRFAIVSGGARLVIGGVLDEPWHAEVVARADAWWTRVIGDAPVASLAATVHDIDGVRIGWIDGAFIRLLARDADAAAAVEARLTMIGGDLAAAVSRQGRRVYVVPATMSKSAACREVRTRLRADRVLAAGDAELDLEMLADADVAVAPAHAASSVLALPGVASTATAGPAAAVEMLTQLIESVRAGRSGESGRANTGPGTPGSDAREGDADGHG